jgi:hypothetical protein
MKIPMRQCVEIMYLLTHTLMDPADVVVNT